MEFTESSALSIESRLCHGVTVEAFEGAPVQQQQQQDNNSSSTTSSGELLHCDALLYKAGGIKRKAAACNLVLEGDDTGMKCSKVKVPSLKASSKLQQQQQQPAAEFPKQDYIHVRARRGQATDSHSLAERVRREKISERMKFLQDLVPGCSKVTGKAVMLDEIINYVQSLQRQIEFLSMKLAAADSQLEINVDGLMNKELASRSPETTLMGPDPSTGYSELQSHLQIQQQINNCNIDLRSVGSLCDAYLRSSMNREAPLPLPPPTYANSSFMDPLTQTLYDEDLQTMVHNMGNSQGSRQGLFAHGPGFLYPGFLKVEH